MKNLTVLALGTLALAGAAQANLVVNGGFEAGDTGFSSDYTSVTISGDIPNSLVPEATYAVDFDPALRHPSFGSYAPYEGEMQMIVNGQNGENRVWAQTLMLGAGSYTFSVQTRACYEPAPGPAISPAQLKLVVGGNDASPITHSVDTTGSWKMWTQTFTVDAAGSYEIAIVNTNDEPFGNDFTLDNVEVVPEPASMIAMGLGLIGIAARRRRK